MRFAFALLLTFIFVILTMCATNSIADWRHNYTPPVTTYTNHVTEVTELTEITDVVNTYNNYNVDECGNTAIAMAGANNQMYMGTDKPQLSLGVGECNGELASSLMFGMKLNKNLMLNGSWAADEDVNGFGVGATVIFK